ncbi:MAG: NAD-dependent epimerase/dehydratase family protein [Candidatus Omnitrophica bacterium]|nr:NAD-dependent epimerase/dehydratase family protein [Candidatus Omnitrophota bacterium]
MAVNLDAFRGRRVLITGGAGMLGSTLAERLVELGAKVTVLDGMLPQYGGSRFNLSGIVERITFVQGDIRDRALVRTYVAGADYLFNLAAQVSYIDSNGDVFTDLDVNARGQLNLLEACRESGAHQRVVFSSSRFVYGRIEYNPVDERHPLNCLSIYGIHKLAAEKYHRFYSERYGLPTVSLRIANPYGPRQQMKHSRYGIVNWFIRLALDGEPLTIYGAGQQQRDYIYVSDVVEAFLIAALDDRAVGQVYNVGCGSGVRFREMAELVAEMIPGTTVQESPWNEGSYFVETGDYISDLTKIRKEIGWAPTVSLRDGIAKTIAFYRQHRAHYWSALVSCKASETAGRG